MNREIKRFTSEKRFLKNLAAVEEAAALGARVREGEVVFEGVGVRKRRSSGGAGWRA